MYISDKLKPYLEKDGKTYERGNFIDDESFSHIAHSYVEWYEKKKDNIIQNLFDLYKLTGYETGYHVLECSWERKRNWKEVVEKKKEWYTKEKCEEIIFEKMRAAILHLYQKKHYGKRTDERKHRSGAAGSLVSASISVDVTLGEKRDMMDVNFTYRVDVTLYGEDRGFLEVHEQEI
jgi:hypothetical protein